jgi:hypothetical protein
VEPCDPVGGEIEAARAAAARRLAPLTCGSAERSRRVGWRPGGCFG